MVGSSNLLGPTFFSSVLENKMFDGVNHGHVSAKNHALTFTLNNDFFKWVSLKKFTRNYETHITSYYKRHLQNKTFETPLELQEYIQSNSTGIKNIVKSARNYLNFCEQLEFIPIKLINKYRKVLKFEHGNVDFHVPTDKEVITNLAKLSGCHELKLVYYILATSGIRYIECIDFLKNYDTNKVITSRGFISYNISRQRNTKNINNIYLPQFVFKKLKQISISYNSLRMQYNRRKPIFALKYLRKWQYNFLLYNQVPESVADFIQGRSGKSVSANHYLAKFQQASFWYGKVATKLKRLFHNTNLAKKTSPRSSYTDKSHSHNFVNYSGGKLK